MRYCFCGDPRMSATTGVSAFISLQPFAQSLHGRSRIQACPDFVFDRTEQAKRYPNTLSPCNDSYSRGRYGRRLRFLKCPASFSLYTSSARLQLVELHVDAV